MRLRLVISAMSRSATKTPSPRVSGGTMWLPSGETIAVMQPPLMARRSFSSGEIRAICSSVSQPVALTTKQPDSSAWWRIVTSI